MKETTTIPFLLHSHHSSYINSSPIPPIFIPIYQSHFIPITTSIPKSHFNSIFISSSRNLKRMAIISPRKLRYDLHSHSCQENSNTPLVISVLASLIERTMAMNERTAKNGRWTLSETRVFECDEAPDMSIQSYLERIYRYTRAGSSVYVVAYVYIDRLCQLYPKFRIGSRNVHRLLVTTIMVASKYVEDMNYRNSYFARVGGLTTNEMNTLEFEFLFLMKFKLHVNVSVFESYCSHLEREVSIGGGYQIEKTLISCAEEIKTKRNDERRFNEIARLLL